MSFSSLSFPVFLVVSLIVYCIVPKRFKWVLLLLISLLFYVWGGVKPIIFLFITALSTWAAALYLHKISGGTKKLSTELRKRKKRIVALTLVVNFGILAALKYGALAWENATAILVRMGLSMPKGTPSLLLPLGISFYTFQSMGYLIDVYRGRFEPERNPLKMLLFVSFFPQVVQGPISRRQDIWDDLFTGNGFSLEHVRDGSQLMLWGYFKKLVIADRMITMVNRLSTAMDVLVGSGVWLSAVIYSVYIYADFSGGIDIARGVAQMFGVRLPENFRRPYFARSLADFWRRWHITLGAWMREYVFFSFSLSKGMQRFGRFCRKKFGKNSLARTLPLSLSTFVVFMLVGIWHGASWNYIAYGLYHSLILAGSELLNPVFARVKGALRVNDHCATYTLFSIVRTFVIVCVGRLFVRCNSIGQVFRVIGAAAAGLLPGLTQALSMLLHGFGGENLLILMFGTMLWMVVSVMQECGMSVRSFINRQNLVFRWAFILLAMVFVMFVGVYGTNYDGAGFVYQGY